MKKFVNARFYTLTNFFKNFPDYRNRSNFARGLIQPIHQSEKKHLGVRKKGHSLFSSPYSSSHDKITGNRSQSLRIFVRNSGFSHGRNLKQVDARNGRSSNHNGEQRSLSHQDSNGFISPEPQSKIAYQPPVRFYILSI